MRAIILGLLMLSLVGCSRRQSDSYEEPERVAMGIMPEASMPERPKLESITSEELAPLSPEIRKKVINNMDLVKSYTRELEVTLKVLISYSTQWNKTSRSWLNRETERGQGVTP